MRSRAAPNRNDIPLTEVLMQIFRDHLRIKFYVESFNRACFQNVLVLNFLFAGKLWTF